MPSFSRIYDGLDTLTTSSNISINHNVRNLGTGPRSYRQVHVNTSNVTRSHNCRWFSVMPKGATKSSSTGSYDEQDSKNKLLQSEKIGQS